MSASFVFVSLPLQCFSLFFFLFYASLHFSLCLFSHSSLSVPSFSLFLFFALCLFFPHPIRFFLFLPIFHISLFYLQSLYNHLYRQTPSLPFRYSLYLCVYKRIKGHKPVQYQKQINLPLNISRLPVSLLRLISPPFSLSLLFPCSLSFLFYFLLTIFFPVFSLLCKFIYFSFNSSSFTSRLIPSFRRRKKCCHVIGSSGQSLRPHWFLCC